MEVEVIYNGEKMTIHVPPYLDVSQEDCLMGMLLIHEGKVYHDNWVEIQTQNDFPLEFVNIRKVGKNKQRVPIPLEEILEDYQQLTVDDLKTLAGITNE